LFSNARGALFEILKRTVIDHWGGRRVAMILHGCMDAWGDGEMGEWGGRFIGPWIINKIGLQTTFGTGIFKFRFFPVELYLELCGHANMTSFIQSSITPYPNSPHNHAIMYPFITTFIYPPPHLPISPSPQFPISSSLLPPHLNPYTSKFV
jgi:hypothetical protein